LINDISKYINTVQNIDCIEFLKELPDECIDLVLTDPPYGISKQNQFATMERYNSYKGIDFGEWDKNFNQTDWLKFLPHITGLNCNIVIFNSWQNLKEISITLESLGFSVKRPIVLRKKNPMPTNRDRLFVNSFEFGLWATKGKWVFNRESEYEEAYFETINNGETEHPTEKQVNLFVKFITTLSKSSDLIFDPFMGSGTTAIACLKTGRKFIGCEISKKYCDLANKRINDFLSQPDFFREEIKKPELIQENLF